MFLSNQIFLKKTIFTFLATVQKQKTMTSSLNYLQSGVSLKTVKPIVYDGTKMVTVTDDQNVTVVKPVSDSP